jgi:DNA-binding LacI/PurR family transcriptional regulator
MFARSVTVMLDPACAHSEWHGEIIRGIQKSASATQRTVQVLDLPREGDPACEAVTDPVILTGFSLETLMETIRLLRAQRKRVVLAGIDADSLSTQVSCVTHSRSRLTVQLIEYLQGCGRTKIALLGIGKNSINDMVKVSTATRCTAALPRPITLSDVFMWSHSPAECFDAFLPVSAQYDAVLCPNDYIAVLALNRLKAHGLRVPEDLYIVSFSNLAISRFCQPAITTITMDFSAIGRYAFSIWQQLQTLNEPALVSKIIAPSHLLIRGSTACQRPEAAAGPARLLDDLQKDLFYREPSIQTLMRIESCLNRHDALDLKIIEGLLRGVSYEALTERLYISSSALHYRLSKLYRDLGCTTRKAFEATMRAAFGEFVNPVEE